MLKFINSSSESNQLGYLKKVLFLFSFLLANLSSYAWDFVPATHIQPLTLNKSDGTVTFKMVVYHEIASEDDDNLQSVFVRINGTSYFDMFLQADFPTSANVDQVVSLYGQAEDTWSIKHTSYNTPSMNISTTVVGDFGYMEFTFPLHDSELFDENLVLKFSTLKFEDAGTDYNAAYTKPSIPGWENIALSGTTASTNNCNAVQFNWNVTGGDMNDLYMRVKKNGGQTYTLAQNLLSYNLPISSSVPFFHSYEVRVGYGPNLKRGVYQDVYGGPPSAGYGVSSLSATGHSCNDITLSWNASAFPNNDHFELVNLTSGVINNIPASQNTFLVPANAIHQNYHFEIRGVNECGFKSAASLATSNFQPLTPATNVLVTELSSGGLQINWTDGAFEETYKLVKTFSGGGIETIDLIPANTVQYIDNNVSACINYTYKVFSVNQCYTNGLVSNAVSHKITPNLVNSFASDNFRVSKGYFSDRVELEWTVDNNATIISDYIINKRVLGSGNSFTQLTSQNASSSFYVDNLTDAGVLYEYQIFGSLICEGVVEYTDTVTAIGFRSPFGTVTGQITYTGGIAVENVKVTAQNSTGAIGAAVEFNGTNKLQIEDKSSINFVNAVSLEMWIKPTSYGTAFDLINKTNQYSIKNDGSNYIFELNGTLGNVSVLINQNLVPLNSYSQLSCVLNNQKMYFYVNGAVVDSANFTGNTIVPGTSDLFIGENFSGKIDEVRLWDIGKTATQAGQDFSRILSGTEANLKMYLRMNESFGEYAYDFSHQGVYYNKNHAKFVSSPTWSADIPTASQLSISAFSDALGNYVLNVPYSNAGETFILTPSYLTHSFNPSSQSLFIGQGSFIHNNINFIDNSSFTVDGDLFYHNSSCAVKDAFIQIDGNPVIVSGLPLKTDPSGGFSVQVPIGNHFLTIVKNGHVMSSGRFPISGNHDFQANISGIHFIDSTLVKVTGRVVGGLRESQYIHGLGKSKNNIGVARIILKSQQGNGCFTDTIFTDATTGEYTTYLPPLKYVPSVNIPSNPIINFGVLNLLDISTVPAIQTEYDTTSYNAIANVYSIDSFSFGSKLDYIFRVDPNIIVKDYNDPTLDFIGSNELLYVTSANDTVIRDLRTAPMPWPVFEVRESKYICRVLVFETYTNLTTGIIDSVPSTSGQLKFLNDMINAGLHGVNMKDVNTSLDTLEPFNYSFKVTNANFNDNASIPEYGYTQKLEIYWESSNGGIVRWFPNNYNGTPSAQFNTVHDNLFRAYVLGSRSNGQQYVTAGPQVPEYVLRDPPGSNSFATREVGTEKTTEQSWSNSSGTEGSAENTIFLGAKFNTGAGVSVETEVEANITQGFTSAQTGGSSGTGSVTISNTQEWGTNPNNELPGRNSDVYIGKSKNITFGVSETLRIVPDSVCNSIECIGSPFSGYSFAKDYGLSVVPGGYSTQFLFDENHIKNYLIPNLETLRNTMLQTNPKYTSLLPIGDDNYGLNNDDPKVNPALPQLTSNQKVAYIMNIKDSTKTESIGPNSYTVTLSSVAQKVLWDSIKKMDEVEFSVMNGLSYTYAAIDRTDSLSGDSVRWINNQISQWEEAIVLNEWEKVNIDNAALKNLIKKNELSKNFLKYKKSLKKHDEVTNSGTNTTAIAAVGLAVPGITGAAASTVAFFKGKSEEVQLADLQADLAAYSAAKIKIVNKFSETPVTYTISGGSTFTSSLTHETATEATKSVEYEMSLSLEGEATAKISNNGLGFKKSLTMNNTSSRDWSTSTSSSETVSFTLDDPDQGDYFSVSAYPSILGWGPVFKLNAGGATSCPHEDAVLTEYYLDNPNNSSSNTNHPYIEISARTLQREKVSMNVSPSILVNIPITNQGVFNLTVNNLSETNDDMTYKIELLSSSNPFGAVVKIDGFQPFVDVTIPGGTSINKVLTVEKGGGPVYNYDSLIVLVHSNCQYEAGTSDGVDIVDTVYISAHFLPTCTDVSFASPNDLWVLNNSFEDTMQVGIIDYDINFFDLENIRLDYKLTSESQWTGLSTFHKDTANMGGALPISTTTSFTLWDWETDQLVDGDYDLRLVSHCTLADQYSVTHTGVMDRINPHPFGTPSPADGILDPNDDIFIQFNEPIDIGSLTSQNFDIRGVINGTDLRHSESLNFNGSTDYVKVQGGANLQKRSFTIEVWAKANISGVDQVLFSQGTDPFQSLRLGLEASDKLSFTMNNQTVISSTAITTINDWHHYAVVYDYNANTAELFVDGVLANLSANTIVANYLGGGKLYFAKDMPSNTKYFNGNLHEVRVWSKTRSASEIVASFTKELDRGNSGLLYNWKMNEAMGTTAFDHIRQRNATLEGATWQVLPGGNAVQFDGVDDFITIEAGTIPITQEMDFTLEFWFNSTQTGDATLFSNGKGDGLIADSLFSWDIAKDATGIIHVKHNGIDFVATNTDYFDGNWHHFAMVMNRTNNLSVYINGTLENSTQSLPYQLLSGSEFNLGARRYFTGTVPTQDFYYQGQLDEFRFWNTARKSEQIKRDFHNRMKGDETGLTAFLPFESYQLQLGVPILTASIDDYSATGATVVNNNGVALIATTPTIRLPRPVQNVSYTYSVNNDKVVIMPTTSPEVIENVTLDITVSGVKDLHGNTMQSPKTWIAYINKNQVLWQDDQFNFTIQSDSTLSFVATIANTGGASKVFQIGGLPSWISVSVASATIAPNSTLDVTFTVPSGLNVGNFDADISLTTDFGYDEILRINVEVLGDNPNWTVNPADFQYSMSIFGEIQIDNVIATNPNTSIAGFINNQVVGVANLQYLSAYDRYEVFLDVYSNQSNGDSVKFKVYDATTGNVFVNVTPTLIFADNTIEGTVLAPTTFVANTILDFAIPLNNGWTWVSLPLASDQLDNTGSLMQDVDATNGNIFSSTSSFDQFDSNLGWIGNINANGDIENAKTYKTKVSNADTIHLIGSRLHPDSSAALITVNTGWNWIGYVSTKTLPISEAMGNYTAQTGDVLKSQYQFAYYDNLIGWTGSLTHMKGGLGYMLLSSSNSTFTYPLTAYKSAYNSEVTEPYYALNEGDYSKTMSIIADGNLCESSLQNNTSVLLCAFDKTGNLRGYSEPVYDMQTEKYNFFLTAFSNTNDEVLDLRYIDNNNGRVVSTATTIVFEENTVLGMPSNPIVAEVEESEYCVFENSIMDVEENTNSNSVTAFPNPFSSLIMLQFRSLEEQITIEVYDLLGKVVFAHQYTDVMQVRLEGRVWNNLSLGMYSIRLSSDNINEQISIVKSTK